MLFHFCISCYSGNYTVRLRGTPELDNAFFEATRKVVSYRSLHSCLLFPCFYDNFHCRISRKHLNQNSSELHQFLNSADQYKVRNEINKRCILRISTPLGSFKQNESILLNFSSQGSCTR